MGVRPGEEADVAPSRRQQFLWALFVIVGFSAPAVAIGAAEILSVPRNESEDVWSLFFLPLYFLGSVGGGYVAGRRAYPQFVGLALICNYFLILVLYGLGPGDVEVTVPTVLGGLPFVLVWFVFPGFMAAVWGRRRAMRRNLMKVQGSDSTRTEV